MGRWLFFPTTGADELLDTYTGASAAFSFRKLKRGVSYGYRDITGGGTETDVAFGAENYSNNVLTIYDQTGNTKHATESTAGSRGTMTAVSGYPSLQRATPADSYTLASGASFTGDFTIFLAWKTSSRALVLQNTAGTQRFDRWTDTITHLTGVGTTYLTHTSKAFGSIELITIKRVSATITFYHNGTSLGSVTDAASPSATTYTINKLLRAYSTPTVNLLEVIAYPSDQSANLTALHTNIKAAYGIT